MKRGKSESKAQSPKSFEIVIPISIFDKLLDTRNCDTITLYNFYCWKAGQQRTIQPWATDEYCWKILRWGRPRFYNAKKLLTKLKLIEQIRRVDKDGKTVKYYIRIINYRYFSNQTPMENNTSAPSHQSIYSNRLAKNNTSEYVSASERRTQKPIKSPVYPKPVYPKMAINTLKENNNTRMEDDKNDFPMENLHPDKFETVWKIYPKKANKKQAQEEWNKLFTHSEPTLWKVIYRAILKQKKSEQWQTKKFIPLFHNFLIRELWTNAPEDMPDYGIKSERKPPIWEAGNKYEWDETKGQYINHQYGTIYVP